MADTKPEFEAIAKERCAFILGRVKGNTAVGRELKEMIESAVVLAFAAGAGWALGVDAAALLAGTDHTPSVGGH